LGRIAAELYFFFDDARRRNNDITSAASFLVSRFFECMSRAALLT
jgi:hypothetical protein